MRREGEIKDRLETMEEQAEEKDGRFWDGYVRALEWTLTDDPLEEKFGKFIKSCPVKDVDCDAGPFYGNMLLLHMREEHPEAYDAVTVDEA